MEKITEFDNSLLKPVQWRENQLQQKQVHLCDRCGHEMFEKNCKIACPNCGNRFDCSDLNIYFD
jgi:rubrerythrin